MAESWGKRLLFEKIWKRKLSCIKMLKKIKKISPILFIIAIGIIPLSSLFQTGLPLTHDGQDHVARIANFYQSLSEGIFVPRWGANLNWGFGHPILMFLYPLPSYIASLFHFLGFSLIDSVKLVFGLTFIISGIGMYLWINRLLGMYAGLAAATLYMFAPYRFVNLYVRGAIGEHVSFAFIPFILFFITKLFLDKKITRIGFVINTVGIAIFTAFLILSHNALSILFLVFAGLYTIILFSKDKDLKKLIIAFVSIIYGFLLSAFFWFPAYVEGKYTLRDIVTGNSEYALRFIDPFKLFVPSWSYGITGQLSVQIGIVHISLIIVSLFIVYKLIKKEKLIKRIYIVTFIFFLLSLFMMLKESNFIWSIFTTIQKFQFPWRFLSLTVLTSSVLGAYFISNVKNKKRAWFAVGGLLILIGIFYSSYWRASGYLIKSDSFFEKVYYSTTDTGESSPIWSIRFMEEEASAPIEILSGSASIQEIYRSSARHEYVIDAQERTRIKENTLYFPGWNIYINGKKLDAGSEIEFQDPANRGVMTYYVEKGVNRVGVVFENTKLRTFSDMLSVFAFVSIILIPAFLYYFKKLK